MEKKDSLQALKIVAHITFRFPQHDVRFRTFIYFMGSYGFLWFVLGNFNLCIKQLLTINNKCRRDNS